MVKHVFDISAFALVLKIQQDLLGCEMAGGLLGALPLATEATSFGALSVILEEHSEANLQVSVVTLVDHRLNMPERDLLVNDDPVFIFD